MLKQSFLPVAAAALFMSVAPAAAQTFPDGPGKDILEKKCSTCHAPEQVTTFGRSAEEWHEVVVNMVDLGAEVNEAEAKVLVEYLAKNWPLKGATPPADKPAETPGDKPAEKPAPQGAASSISPVASHGPTVMIREWDVTTAKARPHDPLAASDGSIWYTGQIKEFALKTPASGPHGITEDKAGNIWYTGNSKGLIGKLDPRTGQVTEYPMPDPAAKDPHSLAFDQKGTLWFTVQGANMVGRMNPASPRRLAVDGQDRIWYSDYSRGYLGRLDPATSQV